MAGRGSRFVKHANENPEYLLPKPIIKIKGKPMILWALESLPFAHLPQRPAQTEFIVEPKDMIFISLEEQKKKFDIENKMKEIVGKEITMVFISEVTRGALETVLKAKEHININEPIIVSDCDHYFDGTSLYKSILNKEEDVSGIIPVWAPPPNDPKWSYTLFDENLIASAVGEKDIELAKQGAYANIGGYYFSNGKVLVEYAEDMINSGDMYGAEGKKEFYVAPLFDRKIKGGLKIKVAITPGVWGLGTPEDVDHFESNFSPK